MKQKYETEETSSSMPNTAKKQKFETDVSLQEAVLALKQIATELEPITKKLEDKEVQIAKEQLKVQRKYMNELKGLYNQRDNIIRKHDGLWGKLICVHPVIDEYNLMVPSEMNYLVPYLDHVSLDDLIDDNGSYTLEFHFKDAASEYFTPTIWKKTVIYNDLNEIDEDASKVTSIKFKKDENDPRLTIENYKNELNEDDSLDIQPMYSIAGWFQTIDEEEAGPFGDIFRREIYSHPEALLSETELMSDDGEIDEDEFDEDNEEVDDIDEDKSSE